MSSHQPLGTVTQEQDGTFTLRYERHFPHPIARVWQAISDPTQVALWIGELRKPFAADGKYELFFPHADSTSEGTVRLFNPQTLLEYTWDHVTVPPSIVRWELSEKGQSATQLVLIHRQLRKSVTGYGGGWHKHLDLMEEVLMGRTAGFTMSDTWDEELAPVYTKALEDATILA
jgi:uncharacterized protein YndB with AHSA1/START domain